LGGNGAVTHPLDVSKASGDELTIKGKRGGNKENSRLVRERVGAIGTKNAWGGGREN